jgi:hypothetical protein
MGPRNQVGVDVVRQEVVAVDLDEIEFVEGYVHKRVKPEQLVAAHVASLLVREAREVDRGRIEFIAFEGYGKLLGHEDDRPWPPLDSLHLLGVRRKEMRGVYNYRKR